MKFIDKLKDQEIDNLSGINQIASRSSQRIKKMPTYHAIILACNEIGRVNLYKIVSQSHIDYYARRPRIPKSLYIENKEGLMIGSACEAGELYQAILRNRSKEEIADLVNFYDYLEIQPQIGRAHV